MKNILVTGGAGFIGSHLCEALLKQGNKVFCLDNFSSGSKKNIEEFLSNPNFVLIEHDIINPIKIEEKLDEIYNLASFASPVAYQNNPIETLFAGSIGVKNIIELALKNKAKFLQASTSEVYGDPKEHPQKESYWGNVNPIGERSCYDESKRFAEALVMAYHRKKGLNSRIVRIFNTYGPKMALNDGRVVPNFIAQALKNEPLTIYGDGSHTRSFCYVTDLVDGLIKAMQSKYFLPINLGNTREISILEFASLIVRLSKSKSEIKFQMISEDDPIRRNPDIEMAKKKLKWSPKISLNEGLVKTIDYFKKII